MLKSVDGVLVEVAEPVSHGEGGIVCIYFYTHHHYSLMDHHDRDMMCTHQTIVLSTPRAIHQTAPYKP